MVRHVKVVAWFAILSVACVLCVVLLLIGRPGQNGAHMAAVDVDGLDPLKEGDCPSLATWAVAVADGQNVDLYGPDLRRTATLVSVKSDCYLDSVSLHAENEVLAYAENLDAAGTFRLWLRDTHLPGAGELVFEASQNIHSLSWSPDGQRLAFLVGKRNRQGNLLSQRLYILTLNDGARSVGDMGEVEVVQRYPLDMYGLTAPQLVWQTDGQALLWVGKRGRVARLLLTDMTQTTGCEADCLLGAIDDALLIGRAHPWRLLIAGFDGQRAREVMRFENVDAIATGVPIPRTSLMAVVICKAPPQINHLPYTVLVDTTAGKALGEFAVSPPGYPALVVGFLPSGEGVQRK